MDKVYRIITSFTPEQSEIGVKKFSDYEVKEIIDIINGTHNYTFTYDGSVCHWREGELEYNIFSVMKKHLKNLKSLMRLHTKVWMVIPKLMILLMRFY